MGVAGAVIAVEWLRFEDPLAAPARAGMLVVLAAAAAALPSWRLRAVGSVVAAVVAARLAFGVWLPLDPPIGGSGAIWTHLDSGFADFYSTHLPFDPRLHADMTDLVLAAIFVFTLAVGLLAAARMPVAAALLLLVGAGWPATLIVPTRGVATAGGAAILGAALVVLAVVGSRRISGFAVPVALALVLGGVFLGTATASNSPAFHWQNWKLAGGGTDNVRFVWDAQYKSLSWPKTTTTMLDVRSSAEPGYFRAAVLDDFVYGRWIVGPARAADTLEPAAAFRPANQTREDVTIQGLVDTRLLGGVTPVRFASSVLVTEPESGVAQLPTEFARGFKYTAWSYAPHPSDRALSRSPARYPAELSAGGTLDIGNNIRLPEFGAPGREAEVVNALSLRPDLAAYAQVARIADRVTRGAKTPYAAVVALDRWFLGGGGFIYSNNPRTVPLVPPLVGFVTTTRSGFCQHFAGAMALMLRFSGIPARVAVGFAGPSYDRSSGAWTFTDRDAHAWVEVWFKGYGWLAFDPTPAVPGSSRAILVAHYMPTNGGRIGGLSHGGHSSAPESAGNGVGGGSHPGPEGDGTPAVHGGGGAFPYALVFVLLLVAVVGGIVLAKAARRRVRGLARDPRRVAAACREELASFLLDQGIDPPASATVRELGLLVQRQFGADVDRFVAATTAARFANPEAAAAAAPVAWRESRPLLASCRRFLTRRDRVRGLLSLRSLVRLGGTP